MVNIHLPASRRVSDLSCGQHFSEELKIIFIIDLSFEKLRHSSSSIDNFRKKLIYFIAITKVIKTGGGEHCWED